MRIFLGGIAKVVGGLFTGNFGGGGGGGYTPAPQVSAPPPANPQAQVDAADAAAKASQAALNARQGARASLVTDPNLEQTFSTNSVARKTLLGA